MQRREKGTGTVYRRDNGTWVGRMNLGRGEDGKIKYKCVSGKSEAEVKRKIRELCRRDPTQNTSQILLENYLLSWLVNVKKISLKPSSYDRLEATVLKQVIPRIGSFKISEITPEDIGATATPEWQTYTYDFAPSVSCSGAKLLFFLGNVEGSQNVEHTVYFDDITLIPLPDDIVTNGNFANDLTSWSTWTENGSTYSVDAGGQCFVANIPTTLPNPWSAQLYQVIDVPAAGSYCVTFKAKASMNREIRLALEIDGQSPLMDETMSVSGDWTNYSYDFTVSSAASGVKLVFMLGNVGTTENMAHTISIDDISLYKVS